MNGVVETLAEHVALGIDAIAILVIGIASLAAAVNIVRAVAARASPPVLRGVWMRYARWLVAGLTFLLASDIVHTAIAPSWEDIGQLAAIAAIRTVLGFFLDRDMGTARRLQGEVPRETRA